MNSTKQIVCDQRHLKTLKTYNPVLSDQNEPAKRPINEKIFAKIFSKFSSAEIPGKVNMVKVFSPLWYGKGMHLYTGPLEWLGPPTLFVETGFYADISQESRCNSGIKVRDNLFYKILVFLLCPCCPQVNLFHTKDSINVKNHKRS